MNFAFYPCNNSQGIPVALLLLSLASKSPNLSYPLPHSLFHTTVWDTTSPSFAAHHEPLSITLKSPSVSISKPQYPLPLVSLRGLKPVIHYLLCKWFLCPTSSPYNLPILAMKKPHGTFCLVQDHCPINDTVVPLHPVVPNPSFPLSLGTLLTSWS